MVVDQVRNGKRVAEVAASVELCEATVFQWVRQDKIDRGEMPGTSTLESAELRAASAASPSLRPSWPPSSERPNCSPRV
jgi:transposase-like protein